MFGERLKSLRKDKGLSQKDLGELLHVSHQAVGKYERNEAMPSPEILAEIAQVFDTTIDFLMCRTDDSIVEKNKPHTVNGVELTDAQAEAWQLIQNMDDDALKRFVAIAKAALLP